LCCLDSQLRASFSESPMPLVTAMFLRSAVMVSTVLVSMKKTSKKPLIKQNEECQLQGCEFVEHKWCTNWSQH